VLATPQGRKIDHGVIIKPVTTNIPVNAAVRSRTTVLATPGEAFS